ncbi:MAG: OB-fold protein [Bacteroidales bacterium]
MKRKKIIRVLILLVVTGALIGGGAGLYMFFMPQRNVQKLPVDYQVTASELTEEFLNDISSANHKYLSADGESRILEVSGTVARVSENYNGEKVVLLKNDNDRAGVSATFTEETNSSVKDLEEGDVVTIKGVIRSGAYYDEDLDMFVNATVEKGDLIK